MSLDYSDSDSAPIKYLLIGNSNNNKIITEFCSSNNPTKLKKEVKQIFNKLCNTQNKTYDERNKFSSKDLNYFFTFCRPDLIYLVLVNMQYPERLVFELISKINENDIPSMVNDETNELNPNGRQNLKNLIEKYQDPKNVSQIAELQSNVDSIKDDMKKNLNKMVENVDDVKELEDKSAALRGSTEEYRKNSVVIRKLTWWQNFKLWVILAMIVLILIGVIILVVT